MLRRLATFAVSRRRLMVLGIWLPLAVVIMLASNAVGGDYRTEFTQPDSESTLAQEMLARVTPGDGGITSQVVMRTDRGFDDPAVRDGVTQAVEAISAIPRVNVQSPYEFPSQVSRDRKTAFIQINAAHSDHATMLRAGERIKAATAGLGSAVERVEYGGVAFETFEMPESEALGLLAAVIILVLAFGSVVAMGLPIGIAMTGLGLASAIVAVVSNVMSMPNEATSMVAMIGLGVGIDYALFIVTRFREALHDGLGVEESVVEAVDTSGRAVIFAGITVIIALLGLTTVGLAFVSGFAVAMSIGVAVMVAASVTLLPALLAMLGRRIDTTSIAAVTSLCAAVGSAIVAVVAGTAAFALAGLAVAVAVQAARFFVAPLRRPLPHRAHNAHEHTVWWRWSRVVQRHPWRSLTAAVGVLGVLSVPMFSLRLGFSDYGNAPRGTDVRRAYDLISEGFGPGFNGPLYIAVGGKTPADPAAMKTFAAAVDAAPGVAAAMPVPLPSSEVGMVVAYPETSPQDEATADLVHRLREVVIPATGVEALVGGFTAAGIDFADYLTARLLALIAVVLVLSFVLLMAVFRSILVPLKAVLMNLLSVGSAYGIIVAVFQWGWLGDAVGIGRPGPVEAWAPMFLFAIVFGLSMDYEVFLLSRMKEEFDATGDNTTAVADGVAATARVITAAALIMVCVFAAFALAPDRQLKLFGMGMAVAVFVDATLVRMVLVPATMELLGARNWWIPRWLDRILPRIEVEGAHHEHVIS